MARSRIVGDLQLPALPPGDDPAGQSAAEQPVAVLLELNLTYPGPLADVRAAFFRTWRAVRDLPADADGADPPPGLRYVTAQLYQAWLTRAELAALIDHDEDGEARGRPPTIFKAWPDYLLTAHIDRSAGTVNATAARRSFGATGSGIVWAVIDSGIDAAHPHFAELGLARDRTGAATAPSPTAGLHRDFTDLVLVGPEPDRPDQDDRHHPDPQPDPLTDEDGHGTHVAAIISGRCPRDVTPHIAPSDEPVGRGGFVSRPPSAALAGMARDCELVSLKVLRRSPQGVLVTSSAAVLRALDYLRTEVNTDPNLLRVHGVNLSLGCAWDAGHYAAGRSPLCQAIDDLADSGVVVVVSAGNGGHAQGANPNDTVALLGSISEPAHADTCIAVGSTHRDAPHSFGVTYTSGKGPTLDGRCKPDVVAPGEWITSAATGRVRRRAGLAELPPGTPRPDATYAPLSGTSMAAPHVSGVIAAFLSVRPEFIGQPGKVKQMLCDAATDLRRERYAQGAGLVDLMRMFTKG